MDTCDDGMLCPDCNQLEQSVSPRPATSGRQWWLSFVDTSRSARCQQHPGEGGFLGVCIVEAESFTHAVQVAWREGCNPGGEAQGMDVSAYGMEYPPEVLNRLLTADEAWASQPRRRER